MAIDSKSLMIGDWVFSRGKKEQVTSIYDGFICTDSFEDSHDYYFEPIPLTAEILEKNGFELVEVGDNGVGTPSKYRNRFEKWLCKTTWNDIVIFYDRVSKRWSMNGFTFVFVHIFQHVLRLHGIEKEIVI